MKYILTRHWKHNQSICDYNVTAHAFISATSGYKTLGLKNISCKHEKTYEDCFGGEKTVRYVSVTTLFSIN